ncbi:MAG: PhoH family protein [Alphaproteobacteria bacterium]|nr:phosphate starvation-inducible protein PhoH [Rhizobiaceae bacterium]MBU3963025.1 PhoH family protein [Alphaproteobacteria bacterium]MBU4048351.1 PhoH family protein [Alphaproteobacteria bacterium]MBU4091077.1 PhoH family protein [Alphaproteobacteria bacterium]MBU4158578.1 PhoH family protein [Alphaproteobacteria bacterium]
MNAQEVISSSSRNLQAAVTDANHFILTFENNRFASELFGQFDQNLKLLEDRLQIQARARGNSVSISGELLATNQARRALDFLYARLQSGGSVESSDVEGAIRMAVAADDQLTLPTMERKAKLSMAQIATRKKTISARTPTQDVYMRALERSELVFGVGPAGTGKTYLAVAHAAQLLERGVVDKIILSRPAVEAGERLGFLPGDMKDKVDPYLRPLYDALYDMIPGDKVERAITAGVIEIAPLAFMRGRTLANAAVILDEAQNTTSMQMKMFLTRLGENARMIVTGDPSQIDLPRGVKSGLVEALQILNGVDGVSFVRFKDADVVRHPLVGRIVRAYDAQYAVQDESEQTDR